MTAPKANHTKTKTLISSVRDKIEQVFGLEKTFTHWDFEELLGVDKAKDRNRIAVMLRGLAILGATTKVGEKLHKNSTRAYAVYRVVRFPLSAYENGKRIPTPEPIRTTVSPTQLDNIFFNLGRKPREQINLHLVGRINGGPRQADRRK